MSTWRDTIARVGTEVEELLERARRWRRHDGPVQLIAYKSIGSAEELQVTGRVLEDRGIRPAADDLTRLQNLRDNWRRFGTRELAGVRVCASFQSQEASTRTDEEGYFRLSLRPDAPLDGAPWQIVRLELPDLGVKGAAQVLVAPATAQLAVVSDIDDTVLQTYVTDTLKMLRLTLLRNARTRLPFEGAATLYRALEAGQSGAAQNPVFYVSSSPWNLYDFLVEFMAYNGLPEGPFFLTDYGLDRDKLIKQRHAEHKLAAIRMIATTYPSLPLLLIGDSGQYDPEIYLAAARAHPGRVAAIYIRHVSHTRRAETIAALAAEAQALQTPMLLVPDSASVAEDAIRRGFIAGGAHATDDRRPTTDDGSRQPR
jgi:phosphatidate phosphatase APP1